MKRWNIFCFGLAAYVVGFASLALFIVFAGGWTDSLGGRLPWSIDAAADGPLWRALVVNLALVVLFGLQHTVMARPWFKRHWTAIVPKAAERSFYCVATAIVIFVLVSCWQPMAGTVWRFEHAAVVTILSGVQLLGWGLVLASSFMINHFELFGLQQVYLHLVERREPDAKFTSRYLYRFVRHPLQLGVLIGIWVTPHMSASHMFLSAALTIYITIGLYFEERDLSATLGHAYEQYRNEVPMILPSPRVLRTGSLDRPRFAPPRPSRD